MYNEWTIHIIRARNLEVHGCLAERNSITQYFGTPGVLARPSGDESFVFGFRKVVNLTDCN
jgi:hypothetical protein